MRRICFCSLLLISFATISMAQLLDSYGKIGDHDPPKTTKAAARNAVTLEELGTIDQKVHQELDAAQDLSDVEKFAEAEKGFAQVEEELEELLERIAVSTFSKNATIQIHGATKPATVETESEWFGEVRDQAKQKVAESVALDKISAIQKQAADLMQTGKYPEDLDMYKKSIAVLAENKAQFTDASFQVFMQREQNGERLAITSYWQGEYARLRDQYNKSTVPDLPVDQVRKIIQGVVDEIKNKGYLDAAKCPEMPGDARGLFRTLSDAGTGYLAQ